MAAPAQFPEQALRAQAGRADERDFELLTASIS
jgi:hypothetical protein